MRYRWLLIVALGLVLAACGDDADDSGDADDGDDAVAEADDADETDADSDDADEADEASPAEGLPAEWPAELAVHDGVEISNPIVEEDDDGEVFLVQAQYSTDEEIEEALAHLEGLADDGWELVSSSGVQEEGMAESASVELAGYGWEVGISADRPGGSTLYTYTLTPVE